VGSNAKRRHGASLQDKTGRFFFLDRAEETGGLRPLAFGQFGEMWPGLEALLARTAKRGADEMAERGISSKTARRQSECGVQMFHMRQRWGAAVWRAQTQVLRCQI
jgi:hypothetical protein